MYENPDSPCKRVIRSMIHDYILNGWISAVGIIQILLGFFYNLVIQLMRTYTLYIFSYITLKQFNFIFYFTI